MNDEDTALCEKLQADAIAEFRVLSFGEKEDGIFGQNIAGHYDLFGNR